MSKGPGKIQNSILDYLATQKESVPENLLIWKLAEQAEVIKKKAFLDKTKFLTGEIELSFYRSVNRALLALKKAGVIKRTGRKLETFEELLQIYPFRTLKLEIQQLRQHILPMIEDYVGPSSPGQVAFKLQQIEKHLLENTWSPEQVTSATNHWTALKSLLMGEIGNFKSSEQQLLLQILMKGEELFLAKGQVKAEISLLQLVKIIAANSKFGGTNIKKELEKFYYTNFDQKKMRHAWVKSKLYAALGGFKSGSKPTMKTEFKKYLLDRDEMLITNLNGYSPARRGRSLDWRETGEIFPPILDKVIERSVIKKFMFVEIVC